MPTVETIQDEELHDLIDAEWQRLPRFHGVYILYDSSGPLEVGTGALLNVVPVATAKNPSATRFSIHGLNLTRHQDTERLAEKLRQQFGLVDQSSKKETLGFRK